MTPAAVQRSSLRVSAKAVQGQGRSTNRRLVLQQLFNGAVLSRADLARRTELTAATVSALVGELEDLGLVKEIGERRDDNQVGKPPRMLSMIPEAYSVVALDLSDRCAFRASVLDLTGEVVASLTCHDLELSGLDEVGRVVELAASGVDLAPNPVLGIGIGTPGIVSAEGVVIRAVGLGWNKLDLASLVRQRVGLAIYVINDANAAVLAEYGRGHHQHNSLAVVELGNGVGAGLVLDSHLYLGPQSAAGEIGHLVVDEDGPWCLCGNRGCLETLVSSSAMKKAMSLPGANPAEVRREGARRLGMAMAAAVAFVDLDQIYIHGDPEVHGPDFCDGVLDSMRASCFDMMRGSISVEMATQGPDVVTVGAASYVMSQELGVA